MVSIVIPVYNEEGCLPELIQRCLESCSKLERDFEIILVDDGSRDNSMPIIKQAAKDYDSVVGVFLNRNYGQHSAIMAGFTQARGDIIITLDADLQNPPEEIPRLVAKMDEGHDVVGTIRENRRDSWFRKLASKMINKAVQQYTGGEMHDYGCMLRAYRKNIVRAMLQCHERSTFIPILANSFARNMTEIYVHHDAREIGESKYSLWKLVNLQFDLLTCVTTLPLRLLSLVGFFISMLGTVFGLVLFGMRLALGPAWAVNGVFTLFALLFIFVGAQFVGLGLLGEYLGRVYQDVRGRPRYFVDEVVGAAPAPEHKNCQL